MLQTTEETELTMPSDFRWHSFLVSAGYLPDTEKMLILYEKYRIEPTYLVTGDTNHKVDIELFLANCSREERDAFIDRMLAYMRKLMTGR